MRTADFLDAEFQPRQAPGFLDGVKDMIGKLLDRSGAIRQLVDGAGHIGREPARIHPGVCQYQLNIRAL